MGRISLRDFVWEFDDSDYDMACTFEHIIENEMDLWFEENEDALYLTTSRSGSGLLFELHSSCGRSFGEMEVRPETCFCLKDLKNDIFEAWVDDFKEEFEIEFTRKRSKTD